MVQMKQIVFFLLVFSLKSVIAQNYIITNMGNSIECSYVKVNSTEIEYKLLNDSNNVFVIQKSEVKKIIYYNGIEESFGSSTNETTINQTKLTEPDKLYTTDGGAYIGEVVEVKRFGVTFRYKNGENIVVEYFPNTKIDRIEYGNGDIEYISGSPNTTNNKAKKKINDFNYLSPSFVSLNIGPSLPFGPYGTSAGIGSGSASIGFDANIDANFYIFRGYGIGLTAGYSMHQYDDVYYRSQILTQIPVSATDSTINIGDWNSFYLLFGTGYYNEYGRFMLDYKGTIGALFAYYPVATTTYYDLNILNNQIEQFTSRFTSNSISLAFGFNVGLRYFVNRKLSVRGSANLLFSSMLFNQAIRRDYILGNQVNEQIAFPLQNVSYTSINFNIGVCYTLGK